MPLSLPKKLLIFFGVSVFLAVTVFLSFEKNSSTDTEIPVAKYPITKVFSYSFSIKNTSSERVSPVDIQVYSPLPQTSNQKRLRLDSSHDFSLAQSTTSGQLMLFELGSLAPYETRIVKVKSEVAFSEESNTLPRVNARSFLGAEPLIEVKNNNVVIQAGKLKKDTEIQTANAIYDFVTKHIEYAGFVKQDLGAAYALQSKKGDCTEYAALVVALARANDIPSRLVNGFLYPSGGVLKPADYHSWAELYINDQWLIVDAQRGNFNRNQSYYIGLKVYSEGESSSMRLAYSNERVQITMNP